MAAKTSAGSAERHKRTSKERERDVCLTCEARAWLVVTGEIVVRGTDDRQKQVGPTTSWTPTSPRRGDLGAEQLGTTHRSQPV